MEIGIWQRLQFFKIYLYILEVSNKLNDGHARWYERNQNTSILQPVAGQVSDTNVHQMSVGHELVVDIMGLLTSSHTHNYRAGV